MHPTFSSLLRSGSANQTVLQAMGGQTVVPRNKSMLLAEQHIPYSFYFLDEQVAVVQWLLST